MNKTIEYIKSKIEKTPDVGLILGSGLGDFADNIENKIVIKYEELEDFPVSTVKGHSGELIFGNIGDLEVVAMKGRIHFYEGIGIEKVVYPTKVLCDLGIKILIVTNAAGGANESFNPGDLMLITDHINFAGVNPLIGPNDDSIGPRFLDQSYAYDRELRNITKDAAKKLNINLQEGTYMWFSGPTYETTAEVKFARIVGADAVGMSTVPEVIVANHRGVRVLGISCITNMAAGILDEPLDHKDVIEVSNRVKDKFKTLITEILKEI